MYVSTTLDTLFVPDLWRTDTIWSQPREGVTNQPRGKPVLFYRLTPTVYAWLWSRLNALDARATQAVRGEGTTKEAVKLFEAVRDAAAKIQPIDDWVATNLNQDEVRTAFAMPAAELCLPASPPAWVDAFGPGM